MRPSALTRRARTSSSASPRRRSPRRSRSAGGERRTRPRRRPPRRPGGTIPARGRPPSSRSSAWARTVLPAPVSPVSTVRPGPSRSSARSISRRFSTRSSSSTPRGSTSRRRRTRARSPQAPHPQCPADALSAPAGRSARAAGGRSSRPAAGRAGPASRTNSHVRVLARRQLGHRASVDVELHGLLAARVVDGQQIVRRDDQRARGERVRRDEGDDEALDAPGQHGPAVGEVVARRALRRGDHEPVAAHAADLLARRARSARSATRRPGLRCTDMSLSAIHVPSGRPTRIAGSGSVSKSPVEGAVEVVRQPVGIQRGEEPDLAEVDREDGHARARVRAQRA